MYRDTKRIISPLKRWLLAKSKCVGCGRDLVRDEASNTKTVTCLCKRVFVWEGKEKIFRQAYLEDL